MFKILKYDVFLTSWLIFVTLLACCRTDRSCRASDSAYSYTFLLGEVRLSSVTFVHRV